MNLKKLGLITILAASSLLSACSGCSNTNVDSSSDVSSVNPSSTIDPDQEKELPEGTPITCYLVLTPIGLFEGNAGKDVPEYFLENTVALETKVGDALPGADKVTSTSGATFSGWMKYDGGGAPTKYEKAPNKNHQILYANFSGGSGEGGGGGGGGGESTAPTSGFHVKVTSGTTVTYYHAVDTGQESYGKHVYKAEGVSLKQNDFIQMYDGANATAFNCKDGCLYTESGLESGFTRETEGVRVNTAGSYVIEIQLKFNDNSFYIHH